MSLSNKDGIRKSNVPQKYYNEENRLASFDKWTKSRIELCNLAKFGFYYTGHDDTVKCAFCEVEKNNWTHGDHPRTEHALISPKCPLLLRKARLNIPLEEDLEDQLPNKISIKTNSDGEEEIRLKGFDAIHHPDYRMQASRIQSFIDWPKSMKQTPNELSDAGFFFVGNSDRVKCFCCGGTIENWNTSWDPWEQHVHRFEDCMYVQLCQTPEFIQRVKNKFSNPNKRRKTRAKKNKNNNPEPKLEGNVAMVFSKTCTLCNKDELNAMFFPCMHICACINCGLKLSKCPICHVAIKDVKRCYICENIEIK